MTELTTPFLLFKVVTWYRAKLYMVIGKAIPVPHIKDPSTEEIQKYLQLFIQGMQEIYLKHQAEAGYPHSKLVIM